MVASSADRSGVLVLRVWREDDADEPEARLRARLTGSSAADPEIRTSTIAAGVDGICDAVRHWLQDSFGVGGCPPRRE